MGMSTRDSGADDDKLQKLTSLWEEYKYRHDLLWRITFQITVASVLLAIVPYTADPATLGIVALAPPLLAVVLVVLGIVVVSVERKLFLPVRDKYWAWQKEIFSINQPENFSASQLQRRLIGGGHTVYFFLILLALGLSNFVYLVCEKYSDCC
jgi:hypothetical protein